jgi:hypothetical protein
MSNTLRFYLNLPIAAISSVAFLWPHFPYGRWLAIGLMLVFFEVRKPYHERDHHKYPFWFRSVFSWVLVFGLGCLVGQWFGPGEFKVAFTLGFRICWSLYLLCFVCLDYCQLFQRKL